MQTNYTEISHFILYYNLTGKQLIHVKNTNQPWSAEESMYKVKSKQCMYIQRTVCT